MAPLKKIPASAIKQKMVDPKSEEDSTTELIFEKGDVREYPVSVPSEKILKARSVISIYERGLILGLTIIALIVRFSNLSNPNSVVFDEVHFGGFARKYILGNFFMDVHPPLAKLLFAAVGLLGGFKGNFEFKEIGDVFPKDVPYLLMRELACFFGIGTVVLMYLTLRATGCKPFIAFVTSVLLIVENSNATLSQYILLDSPLIFFIALSAYFLVKLDLHQNFSFGWFKFLIASGVGLGLALSSKWVGLFTFFWAGAITAINLWFTIGDLNISSKDIVKKTTFKLAGLIGIPFVIYCAFFYVHFKVLVHEGDGAAFLSSAFRSSFDDTSVPKETYASVGVSSIVTLRHLNTNGGYLHSHDHLYEGGSGQQQLTLYPHLDYNNKFQVELYNDTSEPLDFVPILEGTKIRLRHMSTHRRVHAHDIRPAVSEIEWQNEASCYGFEGFDGDPNDDFIVEIEESQSTGLGKERLRAIETVFRLRHAMTGCYLWSHETKLPKWGFEQQEVTCAQQGIKPLSLWYIEENENIYLERDAEKISYKELSFWEKFVELHKRMWTANNGLTQPHVYESKPETWPFLKRGISYWRIDNHQIYLLGNPIVWWLASFIFIPFGIYTVVQILKWKFSYTIANNPVLFNYNIYAAEYLLGWFLHYFPSFLMERQLFLHHYVPALYFGILALGQTFEVFYSYVFKNNKYIAHALIGLVLSASVYSFYQRSPLLYGTDWTKSECEASKLLSNWDYDCNIYPDSYITPDASATPNVEQIIGQPINFEDALKIEVPQDNYVESTIEEPFDPSHVVEETPVVNEESKALDETATTETVAEQEIVVEKETAVKDEL